MCREVCAMNDILFGNNNGRALNRLAKRSLQSTKNTIAVLAIMLATLLFTSLFTIAASLQASMQDSNMRTIGTFAHAGIVTIVNPLIFLTAVLFSVITVFISCRKPARMAAKVSPMEALRYVEQQAVRKKQKRSSHISPVMLAKGNLGRNRKIAIIP